MDKLNTHIERLLMTGFIKTNNEQEIIATKLVNGSILVVSSGSTLKLIFDLLTSRIPEAASTVVLVALMLFVLFINKSKGIRIGKWYFVVGLLLYLSTFSFVFGRSVGCDFGILGVIAISGVLFSQIRSYLSIVALAIFLFFISYYLETLYGKQVQVKSEEIIYIFIFSMSSVVAYLVIVNFIDTITKQNKILNRLNSKLSYSENKISSQNAQLRIANKDLEQFVYIAAHDLKTPLRNIRSFIDLELRRNKKETSSDYLNMAQQNTEQLWNVVSDILDYSGVDGRREKEDWIELNDVYKKAIINLQLQMTESNATVNVQSLPKIYGPEIQMVLLFQNIIENAIKYNTSQNPTIHISAHQNDQVLEIIFEDNGIGIDPSQDDKIFEMFSRVHTEGHYDGTGIGLATCKKILDQLGGKISASPNPTGGSIFTVEIPSERTWGNLKVNL